MYYLFRLRIVFLVVGKAATVVNKFIITITFNKITFNEIAFIEVIFESSIRNKLNISRVRKS